MWLNDHSVCLHAHRSDSLSTRCWTPRRRAEISQRWQRHSQIVLNLKQLLIVNCLKFKTIPIAVPALLSGLQARRRSRSSASDSREHVYAHVSKQKGSGGGIWDAGPIQRCRAQDYKPTEGCREHQVHLVPINHCSHKWNDHDL